MKSGWKEEALGEVCDVRRGTTITQKLVNAGTVPVIAGGVGPAYYHSEANRPANVITVSGSGAGAGFVNFFEIPIFASDCTTVLPRDREELNVQYVFYFLKSRQNYIQTELRQGAAQPHVYARDLAQIPIPFPTVEAQQQIVAVLDEAFEGLSRAQANGEANFRDGRELFEASLRAVFDEASTGWPMRTLPEVCVDFGRGKSRHRPRNDASLYDGDIPFVQTGDLSNADHLITAFSQTYSERGLAQSKLWPAGTVCIAIVGATIGESGILDFDACFPDSVIGMTADQTKADPEYIEYLLQSFKAELKEAGKGSARDNINLATFEGRLFPMPDVSTQSELLPKNRTVTEATI